MLDGFVSNKDGSMLKQAIPVKVKARDPFLETEKKLGPVLSLETGKQNSLAIVKVEAPLQIQKYPSP